MTDLQMQLQKAIIEGNKWKDLVCLFFSITLNNLY